MGLEFIILLALIIAGFGGLFWFLSRRKSGGGQETQQLQQMQNMFLMMQNQVNELNRTLDARLAESANSMQQHFGTISTTMQQQMGMSNRIVQEVTEKVTKLDETNRQVVNFADQLNKLQDILRNPKHRGILGEYQLEMVLKNAFHPKQYQMQYKFADGDIVDAVLFLGEKIVPIDSKFSLENYNRIVEETDSARREELQKLFKQDLKTRIDETSKYVRQNEGTTDFAFMFIPAEGIYYDLLINQVGAVKINTRDLIDYAVNEKHVHIVSPTTFYVALQSLWQGMRAYQIQESTKEILKNVQTLAKHIKAYEDYYKKVGAHLGTTVNMYNNAYRELAKIDKDVLRISGERADITPELIAGPSMDDSGEFTKSL